MKKSPLALAALGCGLVVVVLIGTFVFRTVSDGGGTHKTKQTAEQAKADPTSIRLIATGDTIGHDSVNAQAKQANGAYKYAPMMEQMRPFFDKADVRFCNQATPAGGTSFGVTGYPVFNAPFEFTRDMVETGCNLVNIGTNHTNDKGQPLIDAAVGEWARQKGVLAYAGANRSATERDAVKTFAVKGVKFAFLSYTTYSNNTELTPYGVTMYNKQLAASQLKQADAEADIVLVSMRWGTEYSAGINDKQTEIAQDLADMGADVVLGHGPHVLEPVKRLKGSGGNETLVWYSLGNFLNSQVEIEALTGVIAIMDIDVATKKVTYIGALPIYMHYEWTAQQKAVEDLNARRNLGLYPLDGAKDLLAKSQNNTTVGDQTDRIKGVLNQFTEVPVIDSSEY